MRVRDKRIEIDGERDVSGDAIIPGTVFACRRITPTGKNTTGILDGKGTFFHKQLVGLVAIAGDRSGWFAYDDNWTVHGFEPLDAELVVKGNLD